MKIGMTKEQVLKYLKGRMRFVKGHMVNGQFDPQASMISKEDDAEKRIHLGAAMAKINDIKTDALRRAQKR